MVIKMRKMRGTDEFGREYEFDISEIRRKLDEIKKDISKVMQMLVEKSDTEHLKELNYLGYVLKEIDELKNIYF